MEEFMGTPGPWFEHREGFSTVYVEARIRYGVIQEVASCGPTEAGQEAQSANARLIASAPDLLEALQQLLIRIADDEEYGPDHAITVARNAIAKAIGK